MRIRRAGAGDAAVLTALALKLWPEYTAQALDAEMLPFLESPDMATFFAEADGDAIGFALASIRRDPVSGATTNPVGYLEGIYVEDGHRGRGMAAALLAACEAWAGEKGVTEFGSDCLLENDMSLAFHTATGFVEASRLICFIKPLKG